MADELQSGTAVEVRVRKCVFVGFVVSADDLNVRVEMDGCLKSGTLVSISDPEAVYDTVQGRVFECTATSSGGFCLNVVRTPEKSDNLSDSLLVWPPNSLQFAHM
ncbi:MAG TPA: hypothetical protein VER03_04360 [Bryobacteraceae bacterium]|nr:hypothetical protein [Bryobacteraceae bacterium]